MSLELKKAIMDYIFENLNDFQVINNTVKHFSAYIYDSEGNHLIGGEAIHNFIVGAVKLVRQ